MGREMQAEHVSQLSLPPGFRFFPTDEELLVHYLCRKVAGHHFSLQIIGEIDLYKFDPWVLPSKALFGEKEWYFFSPRDRKYPNGSRPNRVAGSGYWKATGTDKIITAEGRKVGIKKALVFYIGKAPKGTKTNWIMHEYRLYDAARKKGTLRLDDWVLCRIYKKNSSLQKATSSGKEEQSSNVTASSSSSYLDDVLDSLPELDDRFFALPRINSLKSPNDNKLNFQNYGAGKQEWSSQTSLGARLTDIGHNCQNKEAYLPAIPSQICHVESASEVMASSSIEEEVESALKSQQVENSLLFQHNGNPFWPTPFGNSCNQDMTTQQRQQPPVNLMGDGRFGFRQ